MRNYLNVLQPKTNKTLKFFKNSKQTETTKLYIKFMT